MLIIILYVDQFQSLMYHYFQFLTLDIMVLKENDIKILKGNYNQLTVYKHHI